MERISLTLWLVLGIAIAAAAPAGAVGPFDAGVPDSSSPFDLSEPPDLSTAPDSSTPPPDLSAPPDLSSEDLLVVATPFDLAQPPRRALIKIASGAAHSLALKDDGTVWSWGDNTEDQLGLGDRKVRLAPAQVTLPRVTDIAPGAVHNLVIVQDRRVMSWGRNNWGQLGNNDTTVKASNKPVEVLTDQKVQLGAAAVAAGSNHSLALEAGTIYSWGANLRGQLGQGTSDQDPHPAASQVRDANKKVIDNFTAIAAGGQFSLALNSDGVVMAWGDNSEGQLGDGTRALHENPAPVLLDGKPFDHVVAICAGDEHALALRDDGTVWAWGANNKGQLGVGDEKRRLTPTQVAGIKNAMALGSGERHSIVLLRDLSVWTFGEGGFGALGDGQRKSSDVPVRVVNADGSPYAALGVGRGLGAHSLSIDVDTTRSIGSAWGANSDGQLGIGARGEPKPNPTPIAFP